MLFFRTMLSAAGIAIAVLSGTAVNAQKHIVSLREVLTLIETGQPQLRAYKMRSAAAEDNAGLARSSLVPNLTGGYQAGYATDNNIAGMSYPGLIMPISGPVAARSSNDLIPGTALAAFLQWTPLTFGQRAAAVEKAVAQFKLSGRAYDDALFHQRYAGILAYMSIIYLQKLQQTQQANIDRTVAGLQQSMELARQGLRPGLDTVQFQSQLAQATMEQLNTRRLFIADVLELCRLTGLPDKPDDLVFSDTTFVLRLPAAPDTSGSYTQHPTYQFYQAQLDLSAANFKEAQRAWRPRLDIWANAYARGSGIDAGGIVNKADGWALSRTNYGAGVQISLPFLQFARVNIQKRQYRHLVAADQEQLAQVDMNLRRQIETAASEYEQDLLLAREAPVQSRAARLAYQGLELSYKSGLVDFTRLAQGQYQLSSAEMMEADANLRVWRALLDIGVAKGNLNIFTDQLQ